MFFFEVHCKAGGDKTTLFLNVYKCNVFSPFAVGCLAGLGDSQRIKAYQVIIMISKPKSFFFWTYKKLNPSNLQNSVFEFSQLSFTNKNRLR